ncbi:hypothetical protein HMPREF2678_03835 [Corynebacterium sp. HMSC058E07]|nr:hypothetical protein HMPREF2678_03835 [Corynebacterium sp. HMSC058E07]
MLLFAGDSIAVSVEAATVTGGVGIQGSCSGAFGLSTVAEVLRWCRRWFRCGCWGWLWACRCDLSGRWGVMMVYIIVVVVGSGNFLVLTRWLLWLG